MARRIRVKCVPRERYYPGKSLEERMFGAFLLLKSPAEPKRPFDMLWDPVRQSS